MAQLGLMLAVFDAYRLETRSFRILVLLAMAALPVHYLAPYRWKKPLFVAVSILGMVLVNGLSTAGGVLAVSAVLLVLAAAPLPWRIRVGLIAALAVSLAVLRSRAGARRRGDLDRGHPGCRDDVHVPDDHLSLRAEARPRP